MIKNRKGFTLIEMLIVITIIALLASLILVGMGGARAKTRDSRRVADLHNVMNALELYYSLNYAYPDASNWTELTNELTTVSGVVSRIPQDPLSAQGNTYEYGVRDSDYQDYVLGVELETEDAVLQDSYNLDIYGVSCSNSQVYCIIP